MAAIRKPKVKKKFAINKLTDTQRWVLGFILLFISCYMIVGVVYHYIYWAEDQAIVRFSSIFNSDSKNGVGPLGAVIGHYLVGQWFGVFGIVLPIILFILSLRVMRFKTLLLKRLALICAFIMILGSVSLGFIFGEMNSIFGTGLGGAHGIYIANLLQSFMGPVGVALLLITLVVLVGVYINSNTIKVVNKVGKGIVSQGAKVGDVVTKTAIKAKEETAKLKHEVSEVNNSDNQEDNKIDLDEIIYPEDDNKEEEFIIEPAQENQPIAPINDDSEFEIIDYTDSQGKTLSVGGVVESEVGDGDYVDPNGEMKIVVAENKDIIIDEIEEELYDPTLELSKYERPSVALLEDHSRNVRVSEEEIYEHKNKIVETLDSFKIKIQKITATIGPTVTLYEIIPAPGIRISRIQSLENDIALSLSALGIRIIAPIPGKGTVGIEVPNKDKEIVSMQSVIRSMKFQESNFDLPIVLGKTISNETFVLDLAKMPHLLIAGATGQGKSVGLNAILTSLLYKKHPSELKFVLVDPKKVELVLYAKLEKHFLAKLPDEEKAVITETNKVINTLNSVCVEMDNRYNLLEIARVNHIKEYNSKFINRKLNPQRGHRYLPYIVVVIDEFADLIMTAGREIETPIARIAQLARAVGIHLVIATQRPTTNIITGTIKANFPSRIAFRVTSQIDSRTILDTTGANQLIGQGDMLVSTGSDLTRVQCAFVSNPEVDKITTFIGEQKGYSQAYELPDYVPEGVDGGSKDSDLTQLDSMFKDVAYFIVQNNQGSTSSIQRRFSIGYNRAGRIMDQMEAAGIVGRAEGSKPREVLICDLASLDSILSTIL